MTRYRKILIPLVVAVLTIGCAPVSRGATATIPVSGHRGAFNVKGVPESTIVAFAYAKKAGGFAFESDVKWTKNARMVLLHDRTLDRTTACTGALEDITYEALRTCAPASVVPTFASALAWAKKNDMTFNAEKKVIAGHPFTAHQAHEFVERIADYGMTKKTVVSSTSAADLALIKKQPESAGLRYSLISYSTGSYSVATVKASGTVYMPDYHAVTRASVAAYQAAGVKVWGWPAANPTDYAALKALKVDVIVADDPAAARKWLAG